jgi:molecular chaperone DnaJ
VPVSYPTLALGGEIQVPTLDGMQPLTVPEATQSGTAFRIRGKGMPDVSSRGTGDLHVTVKVAIPKKLSKDQRKLLEELATTLPPEPFEPAAAPDHDDKGLFDRVKDIFG